MTFDSRATIADGIAIKRPGELTLPLVERWVDDMVVVGEDDIAEAMVWLLERSKLVVEGGGAVGVAALLAGRSRRRRRLDGDRALRRQRRRRPAGGDRPAPRDHRRPAAAPVHAISDRPGGLAALLTVIAEAGGNVVHADHVREAVPLHVRETGVEIALETRGADHGDAIVAALEAAGYPVRRLDT